MKQKKTYVPFFLLILFILPMVLAWCCYHYYNYFHFKTTNYGKFINPPFQIKNYYPKKWTIVLITKNTCDSKCQKTFFSLQQMSKVLNQNSERVVVKKINPSLYSSYENFLWESQGIYLVDPLGNIFMYYSDGANPLYILKDLKHVLEVSQIG